MESMPEVVRALGIYETIASARELATRKPAVCALRLSAASAVYVGGIKEANPLHQSSKLFAISQKRLLAIKPTLQSFASKITSQSLIPIQTPLIRCLPDFFRSELRLPHSRRRRLVHSSHLLLGFSFVYGRTCSRSPRSVVAEVVHALARSPCCHVHPGSEGPLGFALAVVLAVEEPASDCKSCKTNDDDYEHYNPAPVSRHPRERHQISR